MNELEESLELKKGLKHFIAVAWNNPKKITNGFSEFCKKAILSDPTDAHYALKTIAERKNAALVTENVDLLQQRAGVEPLFAYSEILHSLKKQDLKEVDCIICIGLSHDDRGFLAWYKKENPNGTIVALNLEQPDYLGNEDFFLEGDVQHILPEIAKMEI
jgi:NAD-dependent SIR2 family protein deacetylase